MMKETKFIYYRVLQSLYNGKWNDIVSYNKAYNEQKKEIHKDWVDYINNEPNVKHRIVTRRELNPKYHNEE